MTVCRHQAIQRDHSQWNHARTPQSQKNAAALGAYHAATADVFPEGRCKMMPPSS